MQPENSNRDLLSELSKETEKKNPSTKPLKSAVWEDENEVPVMKTNTIDEAEEAPTTPTQSEATDPQKKKLTESEIQASAAASASGVDLLTTLLSESIVNLKYYFKIPEEDRELLDEKLLDMRPQDRNDVEQMKVNRYERLMQQRDRKLEKITHGSDKARKRLEEDFAEYSRITGKIILTPGYRLAIGISERVIKSAVYALID